MKKILGLVCLAISLMSLFGCNDDTANPYDKVSTISIDSANVLLDAHAGAGKVVVKTVNGITKAESNTDWCTVSYNGIVVTVTAEKNNGYDSRASLVTIWSGDESVKVTVQQAGAVFNIESGKIIELDNSAQTVVRKVKTSAEATITSLASWLTCTLSDGKLTVNAQQNATGRMRMGYIKYTIGENISDSIKVIQVDFETEVLGNYNLVYYTNDKYGNKSTLRAVLTKDKLSIPDLNYEFKATYDKWSKTFTIASGQSLGTTSVGSKTYYLYNFYQSESMWTLYENSPGASLPVTYSEEGEIKATFTLDINGQPMTQLVIGAFNTDSFTGNQLAGALFRWYYPYLVKTN